MTAKDEASTFTSATVHSRDLPLFCRRSNLQSKHRGGCVLGSTNGCRVGPPQNVGGRQANMRQARRHSFCGAIADINRQFHRSSSHDTPKVRLAWFRLRKVHSDGSMHILNGGEQVRQPVLEQAFSWLLRYLLRRTNQRSRNWNLGRVHLAM